MIDTWLFGSVDLSQLILYPIIIPLIVAVLGPIAGRISASGNLRESITIVGALLTGQIVLFEILPAIMAGQTARITLIEVMPELTLAFEVEPLGMIFGAVSALLWPIASLYSIGYMRGNNEGHQSRFFACFAIAIAGAQGIAYASNLFTLFFFYELLTFSTYPLVAHNQDEEAKAGSRVYIGILVSTSVGLLMTGIIATFVLTGPVPPELVAEGVTRLDFSIGALNDGMLNGKVTPVVASFLLFLYMYGIGKAALMPIHRWLPSAMVAPTPVSALLHAVAVVKAGVFSVVKVIVYVFGVDHLGSIAADNWLLWVSGATIIIASVVAWRSDNLKQRLAYSTVSQLSYVTMAAAIMVPLSVKGAALHIAAHAFGKITLFFAAGSIYTAAHKKYVSQLNGIGRRMPVTMTAFAIGAISMIGLPPAAGFLSKWYMLQGAVSTEQWLPVLVIIGSTLLNMAYFLPIIYSAFFKEEDVKPDHEHGEAPWTMVFAISCTASLTILLFLFPDIPADLATRLMGVS